MQYRLQSSYPSKDHKPGDFFTEQVEDDETVRTYVGYSGFVRVLRVGLERGFYAEGVRGRKEFKAYGESREDLKPVLKSIGFPGCEKFIYDVKDYFNFQRKD